MPRPLSILSLTLWLAACSDHLAGPASFLAPDPTRPVPAALTAADVAGEWRVTASYQGRSYIEDFTWPRTTSPFVLTLSDTHLRLEAPCRVCEAAVSYSPAVVTLETLHCVTTECLADPVVAQQTDAIVFNLRDAMSMQRLDRSVDTPRMLSLRSSRGAIDAER